MNPSLSRRELILRGAIGGAALALPVPEALAAVRNRVPRDSVHCLPAYDRFTPGQILPDCTFAAFAPDGVRVALATARGIEILNREDGSRVAVTPPGFTLAAGAWHPDGQALIASGPAADGSGPHLHAVTETGPVRLLPDHPGPARAASFSPDGKKVAFTYVNRFVHQLCMADWDGTALVSPRNLLPADPSTEPILARVMSALAWYETRGFSPDGRRLYFASDRGAGMLNVSIHYMDLTNAKRHRVSYDEGVVEGGALAPDGQILYYASTRAREAGFLTLVTGPAVPPFLGFVAEPTLHQQLAEKRLALIGNGDVIAVDSTYGLRGRIVGERKKLARKLNAPVPGGTYRLQACSMSPDGIELAVVLSSALGSHIVLLQRDPASIPPAMTVAATPTPPGSAPLSTRDQPAVDRTVESPGGRATLKLDGTLTDGSFEFALQNFSDDGVHFFGGTASFRTVPGGFRHLADVNRVNVDSQEETNVFYAADVAVDFEGARSGTLASVSRSGRLAAAWDGTSFAPVEPWNAANQGPRPVPGARRCRRRRGRKR